MSLHFDFDSECERESSIGDHRAARLILRRLQLSGRDFLGEIPLSFEFAHKKGTLVAPKRMIG